MRAMISSLCFRIHPLDYDMHIQSHVLSGWCLGNLFKLTPRERLFCMLAASLHDFDGLGVVVSQDLYWDYHHVLGHNLLFCLLISSVLTWFSKSRLKCFFIYMLMTQVHILTDFLGSGECWGISYWWPFHGVSWENPYSWPLYSWQNISIGLFLIIWSIAIAVKKGRTPIELMMPDLDQKIVTFFRGILNVKKKSTDQSSSS